MSDLTTRPRQTPWTGRRKATHAWCEACQVLHKTHRAVGGPEACPQAEAVERSRFPALIHRRPSSELQP